MAAIKIILFHILLSSRGIILGTSKLLALVFLSTAASIVFVNDISEIRTSTSIAIGAFGILFTSIYWFYDYLIFYLKPKILDIMILK